MIDAKMALYRAGYRVVDFGMNFKVINIVTGLYTLCDITELSEMAAKTKQAIL